MLIHIGVAVLATFIYSQIKKHIMHFIKHHVS
jgi:hypothetical protein